MWSAMNPEKNNSACVTFSSNLLIAVDDPQSLTKRFDLRGARFHLCFGASKYLLISFSPLYQILKMFAHFVRKANLSPLQDFLTRLYF